MFPRLWGKAVGRGKHRLGMGGERGREVGQGGQISKIMPPHGRVSLWDGVSDAQSAGKPEQPRGPQ